MNSSLVFQAWREILPESVCVSAGPLLDDAPPLSVPECLSAGKVEAQRRRELESGRVYAKRALAMLGEPTVNLPVAHDRAPLWPVGVIGSITHLKGPNCGHVAVAVARMTDISAVGIDVEFEKGLDPRLWEFVLTVHEQQRIMEISPHLRAIEAQVIWCAKEATVKATRQIVEPTNIQIELASNGEGFKATWIELESGTVPRNAMCGRTKRTQGLILAAVVLLQPRCISSL